MSGKCLILALLLHTFVDGGVILLANDQSLSTDLPFDAWHARLLPALLARRPPTEAEERRAGATLRAQGWPTRGDAAAATRADALADDVRRARRLRPYCLLVLELQRAIDDAAFAVLAREGGLWLEFGVFTGGSVNLTAAFRDALAAQRYSAGAPPPRDVVAGFDTFTGLPDNWSGPGGARRGAFSWIDRRENAGAARRATPPVRAGVRLVPGLFNATLGPFLRAHPTAPLAWTNVDCDLYAGARDALDALAPRLRAGARLHFHELVMNPYRVKMTGTNVVFDRRQRAAWAAAHPAGEPWPDLPPLHIAEEARALYDWLATTEHRLELGGVDCGPGQSAVFVVRR